MKWLATMLGMVALLCLGAACDDDTTEKTDAAVDAGGDGQVADSKTGDGTSGDGQPGDGTPGEGTATDAIPEGVSWPDFVYPDGFNPNNQVYCHGKLYACSNLLDDDGDKLIDAQDPECTGPCDNSEGSFELEIPGVNRDACKQDCYWDYDSGAGNDDCDWNHKCDPKSPGANLKCPYDATYTACTDPQSQTCLDICLPITPNGCDCFGCCEIYVNGQKYAETVFLGSGVGCTASTPQNCAACTQQTSCMNDCGPCELCLGKTINDLPAWCFGPKDAGPTDGTPPDGQGPVIPLPWCDPGVIPCLDNSQCPASYYCITGCCKLTIS
jgi:hypothetical protein